MNRKSLLFCIISLHLSNIVGKNNSAERLEEITLLASMNTIYSECKFNNEEEIYQFVSSLGIDTSSVAKEQHFVQNGKYYRYTMYCPSPPGNPFLLEYRLYADCGWSLSMLIMNRIDD